MATQTVRAISEYNRRNLSYGDAPANRNILSMPDLGLWANSYPHDERTDNARQVLYDRVNSEEHWADAHPIQAWFKALPDKLKSVADDVISWMADASWKLQNKDREYEYAQKQAQLERLWNSEQAQVARQLAAGLNPYTNGVGSSSTAAAPVPSGGENPFLSAAGSLLQGLLNAPGEIQRLFGTAEDIKGKKLANLKLADSMGLEKDVLKKQLEKLTNDVESQKEERKRDIDRFEEEKRRWFRDESDFVNRMEAFKMDIEKHSWSRQAAQDAHRAANDTHTAAQDSHRSNVQQYHINSLRFANEVNNWDVERALKFAQYEAFQDNHRMSDYQISVISKLQAAKMLAEVNQINAHTKEFTDPSNTWMRKQTAYLNLQLLRGDISKMQYESQLRKYGLTPAANSVAKKLAMDNNSAAWYYDTFFPNLENFDLSRPFAPLKNVPLSGSR